MSNLVPKETTDQLGTAAKPYAEVHTGALFVDGNPLEPGSPGIRGGIRYAATIATSHTTPSSGNLQIKDNGDGSGNLWISSDSTEGSIYDLLFAIGAEGIYPNGGAIFNIQPASSDTESLFILQAIGFSVYSDHSRIAGNILGGAVFEGDVVITIAIPGPAGTGGTAGPTGDPGFPGQSTYEIAVNNGFEGDEEEWLASLAGATDASELTYTPAVLGDWDDDTAPGSTGQSLDQLAARQTAAETITAGLGDSATKNVGTTAGTVAAGDDSRLSDSRNPTSHTHGNITNAGAIGSTAGLPVKTGTGGVLEVGAFGTSAGQIAEGNHAHDASAIGYTPTVAADWDGDTDPGSLGAGVDQLAERVTDLEEAGPGGGGLTNFTETLHTSSPNGTVNVAELAVTGGSTNAAASIAPKGTGPFLLGPKPDSTTTGGNVRGAYAVDLQMERNAASQVASGAYSLCQGRRNTASSDYGIALGESNTTTGIYGSATIGNSNTNGARYSLVAGAINNVGGGESAPTIGYAITNNGSYVFSAGSHHTVSANYNATLGYYALAERAGTLYFGGGRFGAVGDCQFALPVLRCSTTNATPTELLLEGSGRFTIPANGSIAGIVIVSAWRSDGSAIANFIRQICLKNVSGTTSEVFSPVTLGTDNAAGTSISITANDTNDALKIEFTGIASQNWRAMATIHLNDGKFTS